MIDVHCHLDHIEQPESVIEQAKRKGMTALITSSVDPNLFAQNLELKIKHQNFVYLAAGFHPHMISDYTDAEIDQFISTIESTKFDISAIGEVGLDYSNTTIKERMKMVFIKFIELSHELHLPLVVHIRGSGAFDDALTILEERAARLVALHCFSGSESDLKRALDRGYYISYATNVCYTKKHPRLAAATPLDRMLLETDAPWLDPDVPEGQERGLTNRPWKIVKSAEVIAKLHNTTKEEVLRITSENAKKLFRI
jgi:TatD DNase family protein